MEKPESEPKVNFGESKPTGFSKTTKILIMALGGLVVYRFNEYYSKNGYVHPLTRMVDYFQEKTDIEKLIKDEEISFPKRLQVADDTLILSTKEKKGIHRTAFPDSIYRKSDFLVPIGSEVDFSDMNIKYSWQKDDELMGVPYPNKN